MSNATIDRLEQERQQQVDFVEQTLSKTDEEGRDLVDAEKRNLEAARDRVKELDDQLKPLREFQELRDAHRSGSAGYRPGAAPASGESKGLGAQTSARGHQYGSLGEFLCDSWKAKTGQDEQAIRRLESVGRGIAGDELAVLDRGRAREIDQAYVASLTAEQRAAAPHITTVEVPGLIPAPIVGPVINDIDAARPFLSSIGVKDMSGIKGKTFSRPVVSEHVQMGTQAAEKDELTDGQFKVTDVDFTKSTEGGWANVSRQSIDWTSPAMWDALMSDFMDMYALHTENKAADAFVTAVQAATTVQDTETAGATATLPELFTGLYNGAVDVYNGSKRLPNHVWMSLDVWAKYGPVIDSALATTGGNGGGSQNIGNLQMGNLLGLPRTVVPSFASGTFIIGRTDRVEAYEDRIGFLTAVQPKVFGVEVAYGGYFASNVLNGLAFQELTYTAAV